MRIYKIDSKNYSPINKQKNKKLHNKNIRNILTTFRNSTNKSPSKGNNILMGKNKKLEKSRTFSQMSNPKNPPI